MFPVFRVNPQIPFWALFRRESAKYAAQQRRGARETCLRL
jgi:hypothetical protein